MEPPILPLQNLRLELTEALLNRQGAAAAVRTGQNDGVDAECPSFSPWVILHRLRVLFATESLSGVPSLQGAADGRA